MAARRIEATTGSAQPALAQVPPASAHGVLERRTTLATVAALLTSSGAAWWYTVGQSHDMAAMVQGFAHVGTAMPFDMSIGLFGAMWTAMMVAMMFPTIAPVLLLHRMVTTRRRGRAHTAVFASGYLFIWTAVGAVPLAVLTGFRHVSAGSSWVERVAGGVLLVAGVYQLTPWKDACLRACRTPLSFLMAHDFGAGPLGALRVGVAHGLYCLGCCWALMAVLFVVGLMNLAWMTAIAVVFVIEKNWRHGVGLTRIVGWAVAVLGLVVLVHPSMLDSLVPLAQPPGTMTGSRPY